MSTLLYSVEITANGRPTESEPLCVNCFAYANLSITIYR